MILLVIMQSAKSQTEETVHRFVFIIHAAVMETRLLRFHFADSGTRVFVIIFRCTYADCSYCMKWSAFYRNVGRVGQSNIAKRMQSSL